MLRSIAGPMLHVNTFYWCKVEQQHFLGYPTH